MGPRLNIKKITLMTTDRATYLITENENIEVVASFCFLGSTINSNETSKKNTLQTST